MRVHGPVMCRHVELEDADVVVERVGEREGELDLVPRGRLEGLDAAQAGEVRIAVARSLYDSGLVEVLGQDRQLRLKGNSLEERSMIEYFSSRTVSLDAL